jgi:hypothetical protein
MVHRIGTGRGARLRVAGRRRAVLEEAAGRNVSLRRQLPVWTALLSAGLVPPGAARCFAAEPAPAAGAAPAAQQAPPLFDAIVNALAGDPDGKKRRAAIEERRAAVEKQRILAWEAQWRPQFELTLYTELACLRRACKPEAKPFLEVAKAAKAELHVSLREYVRAVYLRRMRAQQPAQANAAIDDPPMAVQRLLARLAEAKLSADKVRLYRQECDKRTEARWHAAVLNLVAALDERLVLTATQRAKLVESLSAKRKYSWAQFRQMVDSDCQDFRLVPDAAIVPLLNEKQKRLWRETLKQDDAEVDVEDLVIDPDPAPGEATEVQEIARMVQEVKDGP